MNRKITESYVDCSSSVNDLLGIVPRDLSAPLYVIIELTNKCNAKCSYCCTNSEYINNVPSHTYDEKESEDLTRIIDECRDIGVARILLSGGEPLLRNDIFAVVSYIKNNGLSCDLSTNGILLDKPLVDRFKSLELDLIELTINSYDNAINDELFGVPGASDLIIRNIAYCIEADLCLKVNVNCCTSSLSSIEKTISFLLEIGVRDIELSVLRNSGRARSEHCNLVLSPAEYSEFVISLGQLSKSILSTLPDKTRILHTGAEAFCHSYFTRFPPSSFPFCGAGRLLCSVSFDGNVKPCPCFPDENLFLAGNIKDDSLYNIWNDSPLFQKMRKGKSKVHSTCPDCDHDTSCFGGCQLESYLLYGDVQHEDDPYCKEKVLKHFRSSLF